jgi:hypothetical protein
MTAYGAYTGDASSLTRRAHSLRLLPSLRKALHLVAYCDYLYVCCTRPLLTQTASPW